MSQMADFEEWKALVLGAYRWAYEEDLRYAYGQGYSPHDAIQHFAQNKMFHRKPKRRGRPPKVEGEKRQRGLSQLAVEKRIAAAVVRECGKILLRRLELPIRQYVIEMKGKCAKVLDRGEM